MSDEQLATFISWLEEQINDANQESGTSDPAKRSYWLARGDAYEYVLEVLRETVERQDT